MSAAPPNRTIGLLFFGAAIAATGMYAAITLGAIVAVESAGSRAASGVPAAVAIVGTAVGAIMLGRVMQSGGRRRGLATGWVIAALGALAAVVGVEQASFGLVLVGMFGLGLGNAGSQLARYAAAEIVEPSRRGQAVSWIVWAAAVGAVVGPLSLGIVGDMAEAVGFQAGAGGFAMCAIAMIIATMVALTLPLLPVKREDTQSTQAAVTPGSRGRLWLAVSALVISQASMVAVMAITPVHLYDGNHAYGVVGTVMSGHFIGMFALAPLVGFVVDRLGPALAIPLGLMILAGGATAAAIMPIVHGALLSLPLLTVGLGWCVCFVAASAVVAAELRSGKVAAAQGQLDALVWIGAATTSLAAGGVLAAASYATVAWAATAVTVGTAIVMLVGLRSRKETTPAG